MGLPIAKFGWQAPFPVLAVLGLVLLASIWKVIPRDRPAAVPVPALTSLGVVLRSIPALAGISVAMWSSAANEVVNLVFGVWLADSFHLQVAALAGASAVIGLAELGGEGLVATVTDRIGKARAVAIGLGANTAASLLLPIIGRTETGALIGLFLFYLSFEYLVVSQLPMMTEVVPTARATTVALNAIGFGLGRSGGALLSTFLYARLGFGAVTVAAVVFNIFALLALAEMQKKLSVLPRLLGWIRNLQNTR
jgi:predicted MFS family arabinose efflux permease